MIIYNWIKDWWDSYKWNHGGREKHFAPGGWYDRYSHYMEGVHEGYERERKKEQLMTEEEREKYQKKKREAIEAIMSEAEKRRKKVRMSMRDLRIDAWMLFILYNFFIGFREHLLMILPSGWSGIIAAGATLFSFYFIEQIYRRVY